MMRHILIVDDEEFLAKNLAELVQGTKEWESSIAHTAEDAIELVTLSHFDALLLDLNLPDMNGIELGKRLTKLNPSVQIIYMSAYSEYIKNLKSIVGDYESILEKPFDFDRLQNILDQLILIK
jgi:DNA-binding NtrC family response regulator